MANKKPWYKKWWVIVIIIIAIVIILINVFSVKELDKEKFVKETLGRENYEVLSVFELNGNAMIIMKSLGDRHNQVWTSLATIGVAYPHATEYIITIHTLDKTCYYNVDGDIYRNYTNISGNGGAKAIELFKQLDNQIETSTKRCS